MAKKNAGKNENIYIFEATLKQTGKNAFKIDSEGEADITFTISRQELAKALPILGIGDKLLTVGVKLEDNKDEYKWD